MSKRDNMKYPDEGLALHTDLYEINMLETYWREGISDRKAVFEAYYRKEPFDLGYTVFAGLERIIDYIDNLHFTESDIDYLREMEGYEEDFLEYLKNWRFQGTLRSFHEGEIAFAEEPLIQVEGTLADGQILETAILNIFNFQTLIATKASQIVTAAEGDSVLEFGTRRAQEMDAALWGARATYIGGAESTSNVRASKVFGIPASGTHAHALIQAYRDEYEAFKAYANTHRDCVFLIDTYDTLESGLPNAIRVADEMGDKINFIGVRLDSGDLSFLSKRVRKMLDKAGYPDAKIIASNSLDADTIVNLKMQGAKIDTWGVGTRMITAYTQPALGGVYKLVSIENENGIMEDTLKITSNADKISTPAKKQVWRITSGEEEKSEGDYVSIYTEDPNEKEELFMFHPKHTYINKTVENFQARPLLNDIFVDGKLVYDLPALDEIKEYKQESEKGIWEEYMRLLNPEPYPVDLSQELYDRKIETIQYFRNYAKEHRERNEKGE